MEKTGDSERLKQIVVEQNLRIAALNRASHIAYEALRQIVIESNHEQWERRMMMADYMDGDALEITEHVITGLKTSKGGFTYDALALLGVPCPPVRGWRKRIVGTVISKARYAQFLKERA